MHDSSCGRWNVTKLIVAQLFMKLAVFFLRNPEIHCRLHKSLLHEPEVSLQYSQKLATRPHLVH
jgi:hypothetical protein